MRNRSRDRGAADLGRGGRAWGLAVAAVALTSVQLDARPRALDAALADAARRTVLADVDPNEGMCRRGRSVERWLRDLTGRPAEAIRWTGGGCRLRREGPNDAGGRWCGQAAIRLARPREARDTPMVEVYFEAPRGTRPGRAYAFRGEMRGADGPDYARFPAEFEATWSARFPARTAAERQGRCPREADR